MIRAVVLSGESVAALAHTLADLVPGAVEGVVKRVVVAAPADASEAFFEVSDDAGAKFERLEGAFGARAAAACAGADWLMVLEGGVRLPANWHAAVSDHVRRKPEQAAFIEGEKGRLLSGRPLLAVVVPAALYAAAGGFTPSDLGLKPLRRRLERSGRSVRL